MKVVVSDGDDQGPSFEYQGCVRYNGACINAQYTATITNNIKVGTGGSSSHALPAALLRQKRIISPVTHDTTCMYVCIRYCESVTTET